MNYWNGTTTTIDTFGESLTAADEDNIEHLEGYTRRTVSQPREVFGNVRPASQETLQITSYGRESGTTWELVIRDKHDLQENDMVKWNGEWWRLVERRQDHGRGYSHFVLAKPEEEVHQTFDTFVNGFGEGSYGFGSYAQ